MEVVEREIEVFIREDGSRPFLKWMKELGNERAKQKIQVRIGRVRLGNFGNVESVGGGVQELKVNFGPGYRIYFGVEGSIAVVLLCGGDKKSQHEDIEKARIYWTEYKKRKKYVDR